MPTRNPIPADEAEKGVGVKLLFVLPFSSETRRVLSVGIKGDALRDALEAQGIRMTRASLRVDGAIEPPERATDPSCRSEDQRRFDMVVAGSIPERGMPRNRFMRSTLDLLSPRGHLVLIAGNRFGYARLLDAARRPHTLFAQGRAPGLMTYRGACKAARDGGFRPVAVYAAIPGVEAPLAFVSLARPNSLESLITQFPDFARRRSRVAQWLIRLLIRTNWYRHLLNEYILIARPETARSG